MKASMMKIANSIFKTFLLSLMIVANTHFAYAQTASLLPNAVQQFFDNNGNPLSSGTVTTYIPSTTTPKTTWQDPNQSTPWANPLTLNAAGRPPGNLGIFGNGSYRQIVRDRNNNIIWDQVTSSTGSGGGTSPTATGDGDLVGTIKPWAGMTAPNQYVFTYGQEISRTTFSALFAAITSTQSVFCTTASPTLTGLSDTTNFWVGMSVEVSCAPAGFSTIISKTATTVTLAVNSNVSTNTSATFFPWGRGNGTTTFNVPDFRGVPIVGNNNMGGVASANLTTTYFGATDPNSVGALGGSQSKVLIAANLPSITSSGANNIVVNPDGSVANHVPITQGNVSNQTVVSSGANRSVQSTLNDWTTGSTMSGSNNITVTSTGTTSTPFSVVQASRTSNYIIKTTPDANSATASGVTDINGMTGSIACGSGLVCTGNTMSVSNIVVTSLGGMTGAITCGSGLTCAGSTISANTVVFNYKTPADYGAVCDGVTNDSVAIQAWLDAIRNYAYIGQGVPGATCMFGNNPAFGAPALMAVHSNTIIRGNYMTLKLLNSSSANAGMTWYNGANGVSPNQILGADNVDISELIIDGNRAGQANSLGGGALMYVIASSGVKLKNVSVINGRSDGLYTGGSTTAPFVKRTSQVEIFNLFASNNYRTGWALVGVDYVNSTGGIIQNTGNTNADGTQCGIDMEPDTDPGTVNSDITISGMKILGNNTGNLITSGGICSFMPSATATTVRTIISSIVADSNNQHGIAIHDDNVSAIGDIKLIGISGAANSVGLLGDGAWDTVGNVNAGTKTANYTLLNVDQRVTFNCGASCTLTLPAAYKMPNRSVTVRTIAAQTVVSASANVVPLAGGAAGTAILAATAGRWAKLQSDGTNWVIMNAN